MPRGGHSSLHCRPSRTADCTPTAPSGSGGSLAPPSSPPLAALPPQAPPPSAPGAGEVAQQTGYTSPHSRCIPIPPVEFHSSSPRFVHAPSAPAARPPSQAAHFPRIAEHACPPTSDNKRCARVRHTNLAAIVANGAAVAALRRAACARGAHEPGAGTHSALGRGAIGVARARGATQRTNRRSLPTRTHGVSRQPNTAQHETWYTLFTSVNSAIVPLHSEP